MKSVHEPIRECICCGGKFPKASLLRVVKNESGIVVDRSGKLNGRGAYLCKSPECAEKLIKQKRLNRAFRESVDDQVYMTLYESLVNGRME